MKTGIDRSLDTIKREIKKIGNREYNQSQVRDNLMNWLTGVEQWVEDVRKDNDRLEEDLEVLFNPHL